MNENKRGQSTLQRPFAEWRHAHGRRGLGVPNTTHFTSVTQTEDAVPLWARLKLQKASQPLLTEKEYEDPSGML